jgi:hypothetical protein
MTVADEIAPASPPLRIGPTARPIVTLAIKIFAASGGAGISVRLPLYVYLCTSTSVRLPLDNKHQGRKCSRHQTSDDRNRD